MADKLKHLLPDLGGEREGKATQGRKRRENKALKKERAGCGQRGEVAQEANE